MSTSESVREDFIQSAMAALDPFIAKMGATRSMTRVYFFGPPFALYAEVMNVRLLYTSESGRWMHAERYKFNDI